MNTFCYAGFDLGMIVETCTELIGLFSTVKIGRPGYRVTKQFDQETRQRSLLFQVCVSPYFLFFSFIYVRELIFRGCSLE